MKYVVTLNGKNYEVVVEETEAVITGVSQAATPVAAPTIDIPSAPAPAAPSAVGEGTQVVSPMPGTILSISATVGQSVKSGDILMILEAMKMENEIVAPCDGTVKQILVQKSSTVDTNAVLAVIG